MVGLSHVWSESFGGAGAFDAAIPFDMAVAPTGEVAVTGTLTGNANLGTGPLSSAGSSDIFVAKYAANGASAWARRIGASLGDVGKGVAMDAAGNVYVTGYFRGTADFGANTITTPGTSAFLAKYGPTGTPLWAKRLNVTAVGVDEGVSLSVDAAGNVIVGGMIYQTSDFGSGPLVSAGGSDIFLAKYSTDGVLAWARRYGGAGEDVLARLALDSAGGPVAVGYFSGTSDFGGGPLVSGGMKDIFIAKYAGTGAYVWASRIGGASDDQAASVAVDSGNNIVVTGNFASGSVDFGGGALFNSGGADIFLAKYSASDGYLWAKRFGGSFSAAEKANDVVMDAVGNVYLTGSVVDTIDFGTGTLPSDGWYDIFLAQFSSTGAPLWSKRTGAGAGVAVGTDRDNAMLAVGSFTGDTKVNFGGNDLLSPGGTDLLVVKFDGEPNGPSATSIVTAVVVGLALLGIGYVYTTQQA